MIVDRVTLRFVTAELVKPFENRWQRYHTWTKLLVEVESHGVTGYAECTAMETPFYNYETIETAWYVIGDYLGPMLLRCPDVDPSKCMVVWSDVNGHEEAKGAVETALWDLHARASGRPLYELLGGSCRRVPVGKTAGVEATVDELLENVAGIHASGYQRVRIKIRPGWDEVPLREVRAAFADLPVIADTNGAYDPTSLDRLVALDDLGLMAIEQPFPRHEFEANVVLQRAMETPVCLDESVQSLREVQQAEELGACRMVNIKIGRVGGLGEAVRIHDFCASVGIPCFVGAKWDQGIARWANLAIATLPNMTLPSDIGPSRDYYIDDGAEPRLDFYEPGWVMPQQAPGIGAVPTNSLKVERERTLVRGDG